MVSLLVIDYYNTHKKSDKSIFLISDLNLGDWTFRSQDVSISGRFAPTSQVMVLHAKEAACDMLSCIGTLFVTMTDHNPA